MFSALRQGNVVYILDKTDGLTLKKGQVVSNTATTMPYNLNPNSLLTITVDINGETKEFNNIPAMQSSIQYNNGALLIIDNQELASTEVENIINEAQKTFSRINRDTTVYLIPFMKELYNKREEYFETDKYELISTEAWQIYNDFSKLDDIKTNCDLNVELELATDMKKYADCVMSCYQTDDEDDPYGDLDEGYRQGYMNYKEIYNDIKSEFYYIKVDKEIVGTTQSVYNNKLYGIYSLAIKKKFRNKGIGKEVLKQQLQMCKSKNIDTAYLQTELDFYPNKMYKKFGFEDLCVVYYYFKK